MTSSAKAGMSATDSPRLRFAWLPSLRLRRKEGKKTFPDPLYRLR